MTGVAEYLISDQPVSSRDMIVCKICRRKLKDEPNIKNKNNLEISDHSDGQRCKYNFRISLTVNNNLFLCFPFLVFFSL